MKKMLICCLNVALLMGWLSCTQEEKQESIQTQPEGAKPIPPPDDLAKAVVEVIKTRNEEGYYRLFPSATQSARYGLLAYGRSGDLSERDFWSQPWPQLLSSFDSLEKVKKPVSLGYTADMMKNIHRNTDLTNAIIEKIDTLNSNIGKIGDLEHRIKVPTLETDMDIYITNGNCKYVLRCPGVIFIEDAGWFLRARFGVITLEKAS
jgi:hypothetical protein